MCRSLYELLQSQEAAASSKAALMLSLVHKAMAADLRMPRVAAFAKRLLQMALAHQAPFACGCLVLLSNILEVSLRVLSPIIFSHLYYRYQDAQQHENRPALMHLLQEAPEGILAHQAPFACGCLVQLSNILEVSWEK